MQHTMVRPSAISKLWSKRNHQKRQWFFSPTQVPRTKQWWSNLATQRAQNLQCWARKGCNTRAQGYPCERERSAKAFGLCHPFVPSHRSERAQFAERGILGVQRYGLHVEAWRASALLLQRRLDLLDPHEVIVVLPGAFRQVSWRSWEQVLLGVVVGVKRIFLRFGHCTYEFCSTYRCTTTKIRFGSTTNAVCIRLRHSPACALCITWTQEAWIAALDKVERAGRCQNHQRSHQKLMARASAAQKRVGQRHDRYQQHGFERCIPNAVVSAPRLMLSSRTRI